MSEISIIANTKNYNLVKEVSFEEIKIHGDLTATENNFISFHIWNDEKLFLNRTAFMEFAKQFHGIALKSIPKLFAGDKIGNKMNLYLYDDGEIVFNLVKALFLITENIVQFHLLGSEKLKLENEFILDYSSNLGPKPDLYFLKASYYHSYSSVLDSLVKFNLLCKLKIDINTNRTQNLFFIPFSKPGLDMQFFNTNLGSTGIHAYNLWKKILTDRDNRFNYFINNRM